MKTAFNIDYIHTMNTGIGRYGIELLKAWIKLGMPCEIWMSEYMRKMPEIVDNAKDLTVFYPYPRRVTDYFWPSYHAGKSDVEWVHSANCILLPKGWKFKQVCMIHDMGPFLYGHMKVRKNTKLWVKRIKHVVKTADCITVNSKSTMNDLLTFFPEASDKVFHTPLGIDHFGQEKHSAEQGEHILAVGTVEPRKNIDGLVKGYHALSQRTDLPPLVIAGMDGFRAGEYKQLVRELGLSHRIRFTGYITDQELINLYSKALCLVHPAHHEGFGFTVPEAFTWNLPVAASNTGGLGEYFADCVWRIDPTDADSIADGLRSALENGVTPSQLQARDNVLSQLTWDNCARATIHALRSRDQS